MISSGNQTLQLRGVIDEYMATFEPEPEDTAGVRERILRLVRDDLYRGPSTHLQTEHGNPFSISTAAVRSIVRRAVDSVDGIRARSVDVEPAGEPEGSAATVSLTRGYARRHLLRPHRRGDPRGRVRRGSVRTGDSSCQDRYQC